MFRAFVSSTRSTRPARRVGEYQDELSINRDTGGSGFATVLRIGTTSHTTPHYSAGSVLDVSEIARVGSSV